MWSEGRIRTYLDVLEAIRDRTDIPGLKAEAGHAVDVIKELLVEREHLRATIVRQERALCAAAARMSLDFTATGRNLFDEEVRHARRLQDT